MTAPTTRFIARYQAAILRDGKMLLILHREHNGGREYWVIPGGGREEGESEEECVAREVLEETNLTVRVDGLLLETLPVRQEIYQTFKTYLCTILSGDEKPGYEPEEYASSIYAIVDVRWVDLLDETDWGEGIFRDPYTYPQLKAIRERLVQQNAL